MHDEVDGTAAAAALALVEELVAADGEDRAGAFPAGGIAGVGAVAELDGEGLEGDRRVGGRIISVGPRGFLPDCFVAEMTED